MQKNAYLTLQSVVNAYLAEDQSLYRGYNDVEY